MKCEEGRQVLRQLIKVVLFSSFLFFFSLPFFFSSLMDFSFPFFLFLSLSFSFFLFLSLSFSFFPLSLMFSLNLFDLESWKNWVFLRRLSDLLTRESFMFALQVPPSLFTFSLYLLSLSSLFTFSLQLLKKRLFFD